MWKNKPRVLFLRGSNIRSGPFSSFKDIITSRPSEIAIAHQIWPDGLIDVCLNISPLVLTINKEGNTLHSPRHAIFSSHMLVYNQLPTWLQQPVQGSHHLFRLWDAAKYLHTHNRIDISFGDTERFEPNQVFNAAGYNIIDFTQAAFPDCVSQRIMKVRIRLDAIDFGNFGLIVAAELVTAAWTDLDNGARGLGD